MSVSEQFVDTVLMLTDNVVKKAQYDKTIQAQVLSCEDATIGRYRCRYQDAIIYAYSNNSDVTYSKGAYVYILVPNGDMSKEKTILGSTKKLGINYISQAEGEEAYNIIGNNCITESLKYYLNTKNKNYRYTIYEADKNNDIVFDEESLKQYVKQSSSILIGANIKTSIEGKKQYHGHYGIIYNLKFYDNMSNESNNTVIRSYILNENNMVGNPYRLIQGKRQYQIFDIDGANFIRIESIQIFNKDFPQAIDTIENSRLDSGDIEISNLEFFGAIHLSEKELNGVAITFLTPQGTFFTEEADENDYKTITAQVRVKGKLASDSQDINFYWGSENVGITSKNQQYYCKPLGQGWRCLNDKVIINTQEDPENSEKTVPSTIQWIPGKNTYTLKLEDATARDNKIKVAIDYDGTIITKEINIQNLGAKISILTIESSDGTQFYYDIGHPTLTCKVNDQEQLDYKYYWAYESSSEIFSDLTETTQQNSNYETALQNRKKILQDISAGEDFVNASKQNLEEAETAIREFNFIQRVQKNKIYDVQIRNITSFGTFKCSVYNEKDIYLGTASIVLTNTLKGEDLYSLVINNGTATFQYNENGVAPNNQSLDVQQQIQALSFTVYDNLGKPIDSDLIINDKDCQVRWRFPRKNTLLVDKQQTDQDSVFDPSLDYIYYDNATNLVYGIAQKYDIKKQNNQIQLTVNYKGMNLTAETNFTFIKQGQPGTNGTEFFVKLVPNTKTNNPPRWPMITKIGENYILNYGLDSEANETNITNIIGNENSNKPFFKAQLWHSGELIWEGFSISNLQDQVVVDKPTFIYWEILKNKYSSTVSDDSAFEINNENGNIKINKKYDPSVALANIIKCSIVWQKKTYYGTIPIITAWTINNNYRVGLRDYTGFRYVTYTSDGVLPQYDDSHPFEFICMQNIKIKEESEQYPNGKYSWEDVSIIPGDHTITYSLSTVGNYSLIQNNKAVKKDINLLEILTSGIYRSGCEKNQWRIRPASQYDGVCVNAAVCCEYKRQNGTIIGKINVPIHFLLNKYGLAHINGWDGNSVQVDQAGGFILSPQMGAGSKDENNNFTGVLMGTVQFPEKQTPQTGLLGFDRGDRTFFLNSQNGSAIFGKNNGGQIIIDPYSDKAMIYSHNFWKNYEKDGKRDGLPVNYNYRNDKYQPEGNVNNQGLLIDLATPEIYFGSGNFYVNSEGHIHAAGGGDIGGWMINDYSIYSDTAPEKGGRITLEAGTYNKETNKVEGPGKIYSHNHTKLNTAGDGFYLSHDGLSIGSKFKVDIGKDGGGELRLGLGAVDNGTDFHWVINGKNSDDVSIYNGQGKALLNQDGSSKTTTRSRSFISYGKDTYFIPAGNTHNSSVYIGTDGISLGNNFSVDNAGNLISKTGYIGGWKIADNKLTAGDIELNSEGSMTGGSGNNKWSINPGGSATFNNITANGTGYIGGWQISPSSLSAGNITLYSSGTIEGDGWSINKNTFDIGQQKNVTVNIKLDGNSSLGTGAGAINNGSGYLGGSSSNSAPLSWDKSGVSLNQGAIIQGGVKIGDKDKSGLIIGKSGEIMSSDSNGSIYITKTEVKATNITANNFRVPDGDNNTRSGKTGKAVFSDGSYLEFKSGLCVGYEIKNSR